MTLSIQLEPTLATRLAQEAHRLGISESEFVQDALERVLGLKNPAELLKQVRSNTPTGIADCSEQVSQLMQAKLREKHSD